MKFLHTADWQLGAKVSHAGERASAIRAKRFDSATEAVCIAEDEKVDFVLVAGDLFEDHNVPDKIVHRTVRILNDLAPIPVYILPGNHDPLRPGGVWERDSWKARGDHIHMLESLESVQPVEGTLLLPCPLTQKQSTRDPTADLPPRADEGDDRIRIGVAHGSLEDVADAPNFPIDPSRPGEAGLDYLALGDWHGTHVRDRLAYSGTIEQSAFDESDPGNVLLVEIEAAGDIPDIEKRRTGQLRWRAYERRIRGISDVETLEEELDDFGPVPELVLRMDLDLGADAEEEVLTRLKQFKERLESETFHLDWRLDDSVYLGSSDVALPRGLVHEADRILGRLLNGELPEEGPGREFADWAPDVMREARILLRRFAREEG